MAIQIEKKFEIDAAPDEVWAFLTDPSRVARCLPGASITEQIDDRTWAGSMKMKVGPVQTSYKGKVSFERLDHDALTAELRATGQDIQGRGGADMTMTSQLAPQNGGTAVVVTSQVNVTGLLAQFGRGMIEDVSNQMFETFTTNMRAQLVGGPAGAAAGGEGGAAGGGEGDATGGAAGAAGSAAGGASTAGGASGAAPAAAHAAPTATASTAAAPAAPPQEEVLDVAALGTRALGRMAVRTLRRPGFWVGLAIVLVLVYLLFVR